MNEQELGRKVAHLLEAGLDDIPARQRYRLELARTAALARAQDRLAATGSRDGTAVLGILRRRIAAPALALVLLLAGMLYWQQAQRVQHSDDDDVDALVLTDELPVTAYLDHGFEIWLYHQSPASEQP